MSELLFGHHHREMFGKAKKTRTNLRLMFHRRRALDPCLIYDTDRCGWIHARPPGAIAADHSWLSSTTPDHPRGLRDLTRYGDKDLYKIRSVYGCSMTKQIPEPIVLILDLWICHKCVITFQNLQFLASMFVCRFVTCQNLQFLASMFVCRFVCLSVC